MKTYIAMLIFSFAVAAFASERTLLARFEVTAGAFEGRLKAREAVIFYSKDGQVEVEQIGGKRNDGPVPLGDFSSRALLERLQRVKLPALDYQKHFDALAKQPKRPDHSVISLDGQEVEVEMMVGGVHVLFRVWNPDGFLWSHDDDKAVVAVRQATDAFILTMGKALIKF